MNSCTSPDPLAEGQVVVLSGIQFAANMLMFFILAAGFFSLGGLVQEVR